MDGIWLTEHQSVCKSYKSLFKFSFQSLFVVKQEYLYQGM